ncbi:MAG: YbgC/FadM family acyl-CoA thioesterase [Mariprofundales bacterium]|nr:YbgC/FadM family acyl-CoA thioesterase [Mariprofundales bacterium]
MALPDSPHTLPVRIYYEDTDHGGVVYHANYLRYMERARTELLRSSGIDLDSVYQQWWVLFAVTKLTIEYRYPARFNDMLQVISYIGCPCGARLHYDQRIVRADDGKLIAEAVVDLACINNSGRAQRIPSPLNSSLCRLSHQGENGLK